MNRRYFSPSQKLLIGTFQGWVTQKNGVDYSSWQNVLQEREIGRLRRGAIEKQLRELYRCASIGIAPPCQTKRFSLAGVGRELRPLLGGNKCSKRE